MFLPSALDFVEEHVAPYLAYGVEKHDGSEFAHRGYGLRILLEDYEPSPLPLVRYCFVDPGPRNALVYDVLDGGGERSKHVIRDAVESWGCVPASVLNGGSELGICGWGREYPIKFESQGVGFWVTIASQRRSRYTVGILEAAWDWMKACLLWRMVA